MRMEKREDPHLSSLKGSQYHPKSFIRYSYLNLCQLYNIFKQIIQYNLAIKTSFLSHIYRKVYRYLLIIDMIIKRNSHINNKLTGLLRTHCEFELTEIV